MTDVTAHAYTFDANRPFGEQLRRWRQTAGMTQGELARALPEVQSRISLYELNRAPFPLKRLSSLLSLFPFDAATRDALAAHVETHGRGARALVDDLPPVGQALRRLRLSEDVTLHEMASMLDTSYSRVSHIERGVYRMQASDLYRVRQAFPRERETNEVTRAYYEAYEQADGSSLASFLERLEQVVLTERLLTAAQALDVRSLEVLVREAERLGRGTPDA